jgi:hypothetical protein
MREQKRPRESQLILGSDPRQWFTVRARRKRQESHDNCAVRSRDRQCPLNVDSSRPECAKSGRCRTVWRIDHFDPFLPFKIDPMNGRIAGDIVEKVCG